MSPSTPNPTLFFVVDHGFSARYLLRCGILEELLQRGARIVILTPNENESYFQQEFSHPQIVIEHLKMEEVKEKLLSLPFSQKWLDFHNYINPLNLFIWDFRFKRRLEEDHGRRYQLLQPIVKGGVHLLKKSSWALRLLMAFDQRVIHGSFHSDLFLKYKPRALVTVSPGYVSWPIQAVMINEARQHGVCSIATIFSWDNTSTKGVPLTRPDYVLCWSDISKKELLQTTFVPSENILVTGTALFDVYQKNISLSNNDFFKKYNLDPDRPLIFFATFSPFQFPANGAYVKLLAEAIHHGKLPKNLQMIVRLHPIYLRKSLKKQFEEEWTRYQILQKEFPFITYSVPKMLSDKLTIDVPQKEMDEVAAMVRYSHVVVSFFSTLCLEAAICDKPFIAIGFDLPSYQNLAKRPSLIPTGYLHTTRLLQSGSGKIVYSEEELIRSIQYYLQNPQAEHEARKRFAAQECYGLDGQAAKRIAEKIYELSVKTIS